jgi:crotonobetaine/carnitine-CoA ligase
MALTIAHRRTLNRELEQRVQRQPDKPWLIFQPVERAPWTLTSAQFAELVEQTATALLGMGIRRGHKLLLVLGNCPEFRLLWFGAARMGALIVPVNPLSSDAELDYLASHSEAVLLAAPGEGVFQCASVRIG